MTKNARIVIGRSAFLHLLRGYETLLQVEGGYSHLTSPSMYEQVKTDLPLVKKAIIAISNNAEHSKDNCMRVVYANLADRVITNEKTGEPTMKTIANSKQTSNKNTNTSAKKTVKPASSTKPVAKKPVAKKPAAKKTAAKKSNNTQKGAASTGRTTTPGATKVAKRPAAKVTASRTASAKKTVAKKTPAKKATSSKKPSRN